MTRVIFCHIIVVIVVMTDLSCVCHLCHIRIKERYFPWLLFLFLI
nr:MAG TPA: hypothetical protein [Caudoviricetes sp.]